MIEGIVEHLTEKGYGFIKCEEYDKNIFFHAKDLVKVSYETLRKGDVVLIDEVEATPKGYAAKGIKIYNGS